MLCVRLLCVAACSAGVFGGESDSPGRGGLVYQRRGEVALAGEECSGGLERGLEEMISAIWTVEALNSYEYLPGMAIGVSVFDVCDDETSVQKMGEELFRLDEETVSMGIITTREISKKLAGISEKFPDSNIVHIKHIVTDDMLIEITIQLLINLQWMNISAAIFDSVIASNAFGEKALEEGIFVRETLLMNCSSSCAEVGSFPENVTQPLVVIAAFANITRLADVFHRESIKLILTPTDFLFDFTSLELPKDTIVCLPSMQDKTALSVYLNKILRHKNFFTPKPPVKGPLFVGTATTIVRFLKPLRTALQLNCPEDTRPCAPPARLISEIKGNKTRSLVHETTQISPDDVEEALKALKIEPSFNDEMFLCIASLVNANASEDVAIFQVFNSKLKTFRPVPIMINDHSLATPAASRESRKQTQAKSRRKDLAWSLRQGQGEGERERNVSAAAGNGTGVAGGQVRWRYLTWVSVNTCVGLVGVTCTLSIMLFVVIKLCKEGLLEGSPFFMLVLMVSVVVTYLSSLPFHVEFAEDGFMNGYRKCGPPVVFAVLFSLLLSRGFMVAFSEAGGGSGHINGYLQAVLSFFMIGVQGSLTAQNCMFAKGICEPTCSDGYNIILSLVYDFVLLILLACVSPFIVRSKRNCKEGLLFSISVFFITIVWSAWITFYVLLPNEHKDAAVAVGLSSTASVLLLCLFIPQMYFMAAPFSQDQTIRGLSSLDANAVPGTSHSDFKSTLALNDCAFGSYKSCQMGCSNPGFLTSRANGSSTNPGAADNFIGEAVPARTPEPPQSH